MGMVPQADKGKQELTSVLRFLIVLALSVAAWAAPLTVVCSVDVPVVEPHDAAVASVLAQTPVPAALHYRWSASGGLLHETEKSSAEWNPNSSAERLCQEDAEASCCTKDEGRSLEQPIRPRI